MKRNIGALILLSILLCTSFVAKAQSNIIDEIVWVVGDEAILKSDVEKTKIFMLSSGEKLEGDPYCFIPEQLALQKLFLDQAKIDSIDISIREINSRVEEQEKWALKTYGSKDKIEEYLGLPFAQLRESWKDEQRTQLLVEQARATIMGRTKPLTPSDVRRFYELLPKDSLPYVPTTVEVQILVNKPVIPLEEIDKIKQKLRDFTEKINTGERSFASLAIAYSEDGSAMSGGELPFWGKASFMPEFANVAFALSDPDKVSNIVETDAGFHIIQLIERRGDRGKFRHILLRPSVPDAEFKRVMGRLDSIASDIREDKFSFDYAANLLSTDKNTSKNGGVMVSYTQNGMTSRFAMEDLPPEVATTINTMKEGEISTPFKMIDQSANREVVAIVKLKKRVEGHIANVSDDYQVLKGIVENRKRTEELESWVKTKVDRTYVRIDKKWQDCEFRYNWQKNENK